MKTILTLLLLSVLSGCGSADQGLAHVKGYAKICVEGVSYLQFASGASVQYDGLGHVETCE